MKFLVLLLMLASLTNTYSQKVCENYRINRILKKMSRTDYDTTKVSKKLKKINLWVGNIPSENFEFKCKYAELYNSSFYNLCKNLKEKNFENGNINKETKCTNVKEFIKLNEYLIEYIDNHVHFASKISKRFDINRESIRCVSEYLKELYKKQCLTEIIIEEEIVGDTVKEGNQDKNELNTQIIENLTDSLANDSTQFSSIIIYAKDGKVYVQFDLFHLNRAGFSSGSYELFSTRHVSEFFYLIKNTEAMNKLNLLSATVRGEADVDNFTSKVFKSNTIIPCVNENVVELDPESQMVVDSFEIVLKNDDSYSENRILAGLRAIYAKNLFESSELGYNVDEIEVIDYTNSTLSKNLTSEELEMIKQKQRKISYFLIFSNKSLEQIPDFYLRIKNFKIEYQIEKPTNYTKKTDLGPKRTSITESY